MTDSTSWQPPAGATPAAPVSPYSDPQVPPPGAQVPSPGGLPGWTPPPKPGLIPLRPLTFGTLLAASFQVLRRNPRPTFGFSLLVYAITYVVGLGVVGLVGYATFSRVQFATGQDDADAIALGSTLLTFLSGIIAVALSLVGTALLQGVISLEVARATLGEKLNLPGLWRAARGRLGALVGWTVVVAVAVLIALAIVVGLIAAIIAFGGVAGLVIGIILGVLTGAAAVVLTFWLGTKLALVPSVLMLERLPLRAAVARSWSLTGGYFWKALGTILLVTVIIQVAAGIVSTPLQFLVGFGSQLLFPNGGDQSFIAVFVVVYALTLVFTIVFGAIGAVVQSSTPALLYIDIRMRKEGLDLELSRFVEARQAGDTTVQDPYLLKASPTTPVPPSTSPWS